MICLNPKERLTCAQIMQHPWVQSATGSTNSGQKGLHKDLVDKLMKYQGRSLLKRELLHILVKQLEDQSGEVQFLMREFQKIDLNGNGYIERNELIKAIQDCVERDATDEEINQMIE